MHLHFNAFIRCLCSVIIFSFSIAAQWSSEIVSNDYFTYGRFSARILSNPNSGIISAFFLWSDSPTDWREIDCEMLGVRSESFQSNVITGAKNNRVSAEAWYDYGRNIHDTYHTYTIEWTPDYIAWFFDSTEVRRETTVAWQFQNQPLGIHANFWPWNHPWSGNFDASRLPLFMYISYVRYESYAPGQGENNSDFVLAWEDSFDSLTLDTARWKEGFWGTPGMGDAAPFHPGNALVKHGVLALCITPVNTVASVPEDFPRDPLDSADAVPTISTSAPGAYTHDYRLHITPAGTLSFTTAKPEHLKAAVWTINGRLLSFQDLGVIQSGMHAIALSSSHITQYAIVTLVSSQGQILSSYGAVIQGKIE